MMDKRTPTETVGIAALLRDQAASIGDRTAIESETGEAFTYGDLYAKASNIGASLAAADIPTTRKRPRIGIVLPNGADIAIALLGVTFAGEAAPFFTGSTPTELDQYFQRAGIDAVLVRMDENGPVIGIAKNRGLPIFRLSSGHRIAGLDGQSAGEPAIEPDDIALVLMTSGSTGKSKIVPLSHENVCVSAADVCRSVDLSVDDRCLCMWEQYHIGGLVDLLLAPLLSGGSIVATKGFDAGKFFELLEAKKPTWYQAVPTTLNELVNHARRNGIECSDSSLRFVRSVAAALAPSLMAAVEELFDVPVIQTFGMTEAGPLVASTPLPPAIRKPASVGRSCGTDIRIVGPGGQTLDQGLDGEVAIRGPNVFKGYEDDEDANRTSFRDGWFHTGDTGHIDADGDLFLTGRIKQLINRGGEKINPQEVDDALLEHPQVGEAAVFTVPHKTLGEDIGAAVVLKEPISADALRAFLADRISAFKIPGQIAFFDQLPRNPVGKIDRLALASIAAAERAKGGHVSPRNEIEAYLARLWSQELSQDVIGIHDDFSALGGDSLSSMRILMALEDAVEGSLPEEIITNFSTIATLAEALSKAELRLESVQEAADDGDQPAPTPTEPVEDGEEDRIEYSDEVALEKLGQVNSSHDLRKLQDAMTLYRTPAELTDLLARLSDAKPGAGSAEKMSWIDAFNHRRRHRRWVRKVGDELGADAAKSPWKRVIYLRDLQFYTDDNDDKSAKTLVVAFNGNHHRLMMPTYRILQSLDAERFEIFMFNDPKRMLFENGIQGIGSNLDDICTYISAFVSAHEYGRVISLGTSGGGLAALYVALKLGWPKAITIGSASLSRHPTMAAILADLASQLKDQKTEIEANFTSNSHDSDAAKQIKEVFPWTRLAQDSRFTNHNLLMELYHNGELSLFINTLFDS